MTTTEIKELLQKRQGTANRIRRIFAFHYDQIQREIEAELFTSNPEDLESHCINDLLVEFMEETMNWPEPDNQEQFLNEITNL